MSSQITDVSLVHSTVRSDQRKHQSSASLAFVRETHRWPVDSRHKGPVTQKIFPFDQSRRSPKVVALFLLQTLVAISYDYFSCMIQSKWNHFFVTKFSSIYLAKGEKRLVFRLSFVNLQRAKNGTHMFSVKYRYVSVVLISSNRTLGIIPH